MKYNYDFFMNIALKTIKEGEICCVHFKTFFHSGIWGILFDKN